jgi:hypothetical protein
MTRPERDIDKVRENEHGCKDCLFSFITTFNPDTRIPANKAIPVIVCRRYPPYADGFPQVSSGYWCGEYKTSIGPGGTPLVEKEFPEDWG